MRRVVLPGLSLVCLLAAGGSAQAAAIQYDNRAAFEAAAGVVQTETFNAISSIVSIGSTPYDVGPFTLTGPDNTLTGIDTTPGSLYSIDGSPYLVIFSGGGSIVFTFDAPIRAFGADLFDINDFEEHTRVIIDGVTYQMPVNNGFVTSFFGLISDTPFTTVTFSLIAGGEGGGLDNVTFGSAPAAVPAVPEPTSIALLATGLAGVWLRRRRG